MLKIKDDINLTILEKYGFKYNKCSNGCEWYSYKVDAALLGCDFDDRELYFYNGSGFDYREPLNVLYDLIKDGLVEKVE